MRVRVLLRVVSKNNHLVIAALSAVFTLGVVVLPATVSHARQIDLKGKALAYAAQLNNLPSSRLDVANTAWLGAEVFRAKVVDNGTGEIYVINLRSSGELADDKDVADLLHASLQSGFVGKIQEHVKARADADPSGSSRVNIWVKAPAIARAAWRAALEQGRREQVFGEAAALHSQAETPVLQFLHGLGIQEKYASRYAPVVTCEVPNRVLAELENIPAVIRIYDDVPASSAINTSIPTIKAQKVWNQGITGSGVKVAIVESNDNGASAIANDNPYLGPVTYYDSTHTQPGEHATAVAGVMLSNHSTYRGVSYGVARPSGVLSGNPIGSFASDLNAATGWAASQSASVINQSYRSASPSRAIGDMGRYDDYIIATYFPTIAVCAGNADRFSNFSLDVDDPAVAFNVIAVGAFAHNYDSDWSNDSMADYSAYIDPTSPNGDRQKPEIAAPGNVFTTSVSSPWVPSGPWTGTSFAAPHVAGAAALLMQAKPSLMTRPEEVKAILMASAVHNIEGPTRLSGQDGAGGLQVKAAYDVTVNGWSSKMSYGDVVCWGQCSSYVTFTATAGQIVRFVICWLSQSDGTSSDEAPDYDLTVKNPDGSVAATSASFDNNYEIVEFTATQTGTYKARACRPWIEGTCPVFGWAYYLQ